jgi:hypothetical protein
VAALSQPGVGNFVANNSAVLSTKLFKHSVRSPLTKLIYIISLKFFDKYVTKGSKFPVCTAVLSILLTFLSVKKGRCL